MCGGRRVASGCMEADGWGECMEAEGWRVNVREGRRVEGECVEA